MLSRGRQNKRRHLRHNFNKVSPRNFGEWRPIISPNLPSKHLACTFPERLKGNATVFNAFPPVSLLVYGYDHSGLPMIHRCLSTTPRTHTSWGEKKLCSEPTFDRFRIAGNFRGIVRLGSAITQTRTYLRSSNESQQMWRSRINQQFFLRGNRFHVTRRILKSWSLHAMLRTKVREEKASKLKTKTKNSK